MDCFNAYTHPFEENGAREPVRLIVHFTDFSHINPLWRRNVLNLIDCSFVDQTHYSSH